MNPIVKSERCNVHSMSSEKWRFHFVVLEKPKIAQRTQSAGKKRQEIFNIRYFAIKMREICSFDTSRAKLIL